MTNLTKQHLGLPHSSIKQFSGDELEIVAYHLDSPTKLGEYNESQRSSLASYMQRMVEMIGIREPLGESELTFLVKTLISEFKNFSGHDLDRAIKMAMTGKLLDRNGDSLGTHYGSFNIMFLSNIIWAYKKYRNTVISKYNRLKQRAMLDTPVAPPSKEEVYKLGLQLFTEEYKDFNLDNEKYIDSETYTLKYYSMHNFLMNNGVLSKDLEVSDKTIRKVITEVFFNIQKSGKTPKEYIINF